MNGRQGATTLGKKPEGDDHMREPSHRTLRNGDNLMTTNIPLSGTRLWDSMMEIARIGSIDILKIDIEGSEIEVFSADCRGWLPAPP